MTRVLRTKEVVAVTGLGRTTIWRLERAGKFPLRRRITGSTVGWISDDIEEWLHSRRPVVECEPVAGPANARAARLARKYASVPASGESGVYIISGQGTDLYKIGSSKNIRSRFSSLQTGSPVPLSIVWFCPDENPDITEVMLHGHFASRRRDGEWFHLTPPDFVLLPNRVTELRRFLTASAESVARHAPPHPNGR
jgi:prophage regulatory protein